MRNIVLLSFKKVTNASRRAADATESAAMITVPLRLHCTRRRLLHCTAAASAAAAVGETLVPWARPFGEQQQQSSKQAAAEDVTCGHHLLFMSQFWNHFLGFSRGSKVGLEAAFCHVQLMTSHQKIKSTHGTTMGPTKAFDPFSQAQNCNNCFTTPPSQVLWSFAPPPPQQGPKHICVRLRAGAAAT